MSFWQPGTKQQLREKPQISKTKDVPVDNKNQATQLPDREVKTALSKGVMTMKFMKRKADANLEAAQMAEKRRKQLDSSWTTDGKDETSQDEQNMLICTKEMTDYMAALPGRRSFGGFNKAVELNYAQIMDEKRFDKASEKAAKNSVSDTEMLARYESLIGLPRGPSQGMRPKKEKTGPIKKKNLIEKNSI